MQQYYLVKLRLRANICIMDSMRSFEKKIFFLVLYILTLGVLVSYIDKKIFESYFVYEDHTVEWLTFGILAIMSYICFNRLRKALGKKGKPYILGCLLGGLIFIFGAGEEVSWFQRQIGYKSSDFFENNNSQHETNFHNLVLSNGKKINKIVFGTGLGILIGFYLLVLPLLYRKNQLTKNLVNNWAVPVAKKHHVEAYIFMVILATLIPTSKKGELLEFSGVAIFLLILLYPLNEDNFNLSD